MKMKAIDLLIIALLSIAMFGCKLVSELPKQVNIIRSGIPWFDNNGNV